MGSLRLMSERDGSLFEYRSRVRRAIQRGRLSEDPLLASPKHQAGEPIAFPGATLISAPGHEDVSAQKLYLRLSALQDRLMARHRSSLIRATPESFHLTGADLIAGVRYREAQAHYGARGSLERLTQALERLPIVQGARPKVGSSPVPSSLRSLTDGEARWSYSGLALFGSALVALFLPQHASGYRALCRIREEVYQCSALSALGVTPPRPLMAHVTLAYFTESLAMSPLSQEALTTDICHLNSDEQSRDHLTLHELALYTFESMGSYQLTSPTFRLPLMIDQV